MILEILKLIFLFIIFISYFVLTIWNSAFNQRKKQIKDKEQFKKLLDDLWDWD